MAKQYRILFFIIGFVVLTGFVSCVSYRAVPITDEMAEQIATIKFYVPQAEDEIKTIYIPRKLYASGFLFTRRVINHDLIGDLNSYRWGRWYREHQDKIVSIEPYVRGDINKSSNLWQIQYVE